MDIWQTGFQGAGFMPCKGPVGACWACLVEQLREVMCLEGSGQRQKVVGDGLREVWGDHGGPGRKNML